MTRLTTATSIGLALAIALVAGMVGWRVFSFSPPVSDASSADPTVGTAFYAAMNDVLSGANKTALDDVVTSDFVNHVDDATAGELAEQLTALGGSFPGTRMQVTGMEPSANSLVVSLAPIALAPVKVAGLEFSAQPIDAGYEVLRLRGGKVAERWSEETPALSATTFHDATVTTRGSASMAIRLDRTELPKGSELSWKPGRSSVLMVETGSVTVRLNGKQDRELQHHVVTVNAGEILPIRSTMTVHLESADSDPATVLIFSTWKVTPTDVPSPKHTQGVTSRLLWMSNLPVSSDGGWTVAFGKAQLPQGVDVTLGGSEAMEVLLCAETTSVQVVTGDGWVETLNSDLTAIDRSNATVLDPARAAHVTNADSVGLRTVAEGGETVWLITISPAGTQATPAT